MGHDSIWWPSTSHENHENHSKHLGILWTEINSLESATRLFMCEQSGDNDVYLQLTTLSQVELGSEVSRSYFTRWIQFGNLVEDFNKVARASNFVEIPEQIVGLRNALAHGRVFAASDKSPIRIQNFEAVNDQRMRVSYSAVLTEHWVMEQRNLIKTSTMCVYALSELLRRSNGIA